MRNLRTTIGTCEFNIHSCDPSLYKGATGLFIPVYGARSHLTGKYMLAMEGNFWLSLYKAANMNLRKLYLTIPKGEFLEPGYMQYIVDHVMPKLPFELILVPTYGYGSNAYATRGNMQEWHKFVVEEKLILEAVDVLLYAPPVLGRIFDSTYCRAAMTCVIVYWAYAIASQNYRPAFFEDFAEYDKYNYNHYNMWVATVDQYERYPNARMENNLFNVELYEQLFLQHLRQSDKVAGLYKRVFVPFRQSADGYNVQGIFNALHTIYQHDNIEFELLYTAYNDVILDLPHVPAFKVDGNKESFVRILEKRPIVPLLADIDGIFHLSIFEHAYHRCELLIVENSYVKAQHTLPKTYTQENLHNALKSML